MDIIKELVKKQDYIKLQIYNKEMLMKRVDTFKSEMLYYNSLNDKNKQNKVKETAENLRNLLIAYHCKSKSKYDTDFSAKESLFKAREVFNETIGLDINTSSFYLNEEVSTVNLPSITYHSTDLDKIMLYRTVYKELQAIYEKEFNTCYTYKRTVVLVDISATINYESGNQMIRFEYKDGDETYAIKYDVEEFDEYVLDNLKDRANQKIKEQLGRNILIDDSHIDIENIY